MAEIVRLLAFGAGTFCLGAALITSLLIGLAARNNPYDSMDGCFGKLVSLIGILMAAIFFYFAVAGI